jgi:DnaJ like chaperone protein
MWQGKAIGATIGVFAGGPMGALVGAFVGHWFDQQADGQGEASAAENPAQVQEAFFRATFQVMGHIAKADGRVSEDEIRAARAMMSELRLGENEVQSAVDLFAQGKDREFPLEHTLDQLNAMCRSRPDLKRMFVQIQLQTTLRADSLHSTARKVLGRISGLLEVSKFELLQMEALLRMQQQRSTPAHSTDRLAQAYDVLGVTARASDAEVVKAYRRLMNQNHPDKLVAKGLSESMMKMAEEKTRQIRAAYESISVARGLR